MSDLLLRQEQSSPGARRSFQLNNILVSRLVIDRVFRKVSTGGMWTAFEGVHKGDRVEFCFVTSSASICTCSDGAGLDKGAIKDICVGGSGISRVDLLTGEWTLFSFRISSRGI